MKIPLYDPAPDIEAHREEYEAAIRNVLDHGQFVLGPELEAFEAKAAEYLGVEHAVGVNSGTDALVIALRAAGVGPGDEVITTPFSFFATAESVSNLGATPVFVDIEEESFNIDPSKIEAAVTGKTKAILPVHLFGRPAEMDPILEIAGRHGLPVIEDCAQSFGAAYGGRKTGSIGLAGAFSFFPTKNLGGFGDGGLITTDDGELAELCRKLRSHGSLKKYHNEMLGYNSRLDTVQAAVLGVKLKYLEEANKERREIARRYGQLIESEAEKGKIRNPKHSTPNPQSLIRNPGVTEGHVFHQYTIRVGEGKRDRLREILSDKGIGTAVYYPVPQDRLPVYAGLDAACPVSDRLAGEVLSLPIFPGMTDAQQERVVEAIGDALGSVDSGEARR